MCRAGDRIASFDKWAIANTKRLVNASLPPDIEIAAGWGRLHVLDRSAACATKDQGADGTGLSQAG
jgi:hypothetical protein